MKTVKIIIISSCVIGGLLFLGAAFMLYRGVRDFNSAKQERAKVENTLKGYYKEPIFPSLKNVKHELDNSAKADEWFDSLESELTKGNVSSSETSPTKFKNAAYNVRRNLEARARKAGTELPDISASFAFGFERYAGTEGTLPKSSDVARLIEQLAIVKRISTILFDNNIKSLLSVKRDIFEAPANVVNAGGSDRRGRERSRERSRDRNPSAGSQPSAFAKNAGIIGSGDLYAKMHFVFEFRAKEKSLINILNAFSHNKMFIVVTSLSVSKKTPELIPKVIDQDDEKTTRRGSVRNNNSSDDAGDIAVPRLGPDYPVCGIKMEIPMDIRLEMDVYKFKEAGIDSGN